MKSSKKIAQSALLLSVAALALASCRSDPETGTQSSVGQFGDPGSGFTVQCSGWFPDWISRNPPSINDAFQLSQGYPLGKPIFEDNEFVRYDPLDAPAGRPWESFDYTDANEAEAYADALLDYAFAGLRRYDWDPNRRRDDGVFARPNWFHAPMMHTNPNSRREPLKGVTSERGLRPSENTWVSGFLRTYAVGYYDRTAGYTLGQVYHDPDPTLSDPTKGEFIDNAFVFKLIFAEYDTSKIVAGQDPLINSPEWEIQDVQDPNGSLIKIRLIQVDIAVKDPRAANDTGWIFATYAFDKDSSPTQMDPNDPTTPDPWRRLIPVGLQWGADPNAAPFGASSLSETWINPGLQQIWLDRLGRGDRLNGPIDNPASSCMSCHGTAQVDATKRRSNGDSLLEFVAARAAPDNCSTGQLADWYRNFGGTSVFGDYDDRCTPATTPNPNLVSLDYSLQLQVGLISALYYRNANPCLVAAEKSLQSRAEADKSGVSAMTLDDSPESIGDGVSRTEGIEFDSQRETPTIRLDYSDQEGINKEGV